MTPWRLEIVERLDSTMRAVALREAAGAPDGVAILARRQLQPRGSRGRVWAQPAGNLALSVLVRPDEPIARLSEWPILVAVAAFDTLRPLLPDRALLSLKWPNDLLLQGRKLAGILIEAVSADARIDALNIGIGINLREAPAVPGRQTAALAEFVTAPAPEIVAEAFLAALWRRRAERARDGFPPLRDAWVARAHQLGTPITISGMDTGTAAPLRGTYEGIDLDGALLLRSGGQVRRVLTGEVVT